MNKRKVPAQAGGDRPKPGNAGTERYNMEAIDTIRQVGIVPVVVLKRIEDALPTLGAMLSGGLPIAEITFRTDCAADAIRLAALTYPDMTVGAGTVLTADQADQAIRAGASFVVSPGFSAGVAELCMDRGVPYIPGCITPTEIMTALSHGIELVKFFPAGAFGGLTAIKALSAAFPMLTFLPTGGIGESDLPEYLAFPKVVACGGSFMMKGDFDKIAQSCRRAVEIARSARNFRES